MKGPSWILKLTTTNIYESGMLLRPPGERLLDLLVTVYTHSLSAERSACATQSIRRSALIPRRPSADVFKSPSSHREAAKRIVHWASKSLTTRVGRPH